VAKCGVYEIAPISFQDSNSDGKADLKGLKGRIDYLQWLAIDAVWLKPFLSRRCKIFGYDIADYRAVDPVFRPFDDLDRLEKLHHRDIKL
jgi:alpha-glucosidase